MRNRCIVITLSMVLVLLTMQVGAFAHGTEKHDKTESADARMKKMHDMMPMFSAASASLETALEKRDPAAVEAEAGKIIAALPDLKKSRPHRNSNQRKKYAGMATHLGTTVKSTVDLAKSGDYAGAKAAFKRVEEACAACHATFRE